MLSCVRRCLEEHAYAYKCALEYVYEYVHSYANCLHKFIGVCPHFFKIYSSLIYYILTVVSRLPTPT